MDYKKYSDDLRRAADYFQTVCPDLPDVVSTYRKCAAVIETLLAERDAAVEDLRLVADCTSCKWYFCDSSYEMCLGCSCQKSNENWQWRGPQ